MHTRRALPLAAGLATFLIRTAVAAPPAQWSSEFASKGFALTQGQTGPACLLSFDTVEGPRLFVGGSFTAVRTGSLANATSACAGIAVWDGLRWSRIQGGGVFNDFGGFLDPGQVQAITTSTIDREHRLIIAGFFDAPETSVGIGYLDDALSLRPLAPGPISHAWFGGAYGWTPPTTSPDALASPEIIVSSGIFPQGSDYAYRYTQSGVAGIAPGVITVTTAFAEFDDGNGRALFIGVPSVNAGINGKISRWNGQTLTSVNTGQMTWVNALCVHDDGTGPALYAAGHGFRRLKSGTWEPVSGPGAPAFNINALASFDDGTGPALYAAGQFTTTTPSGTAVNIVRLRSGVWEPLGTGLVGGLVESMATFDEDGPGPRPPGLYIVGRFTSAGGNSSIGIARWGVPICRADTDASGTIGVDDVFAFLAAWFAGAQPADINGIDGVTTQDIFDFLAAWFLGC